MASTLPPSSSRASESAPSEGLSRICDRQISSSSHPTSNAPSTSISDQTLETACPSSEPVNRAAPANCWSTVSRYRPLSLSNRVSPVCPGPPDRFTSETVAERGSRAVQSASRVPDIGIPMMNGRAHSRSATTASASTASHARSSEFDNSSVKAIVPVAETEPPLIRVDRSRDGLGVTSARPDREVPVQRPGSNSRLHSIWKERRLGRLQVQSRCR